MIEVHVNDVLIARADELRRGSLLQLGNRHTKDRQNQDDHATLRSSAGHVDDNGSLGRSSRKQDRNAAEE